MADSDKEPVLTAFNEALNSHGYSFQYAVLEDLRKLEFMRASAWIFQAAEFPVEVRDKSTRIDFILKHKDREFFLVGECKRAKPAYSTWCFAKAPFVARNKDKDAIVIERITRSPQEGNARASIVWAGNSPNAVHIATAVRTNQKVESKGVGRDAIEEAATQVCRGLNGLIQFRANELLASAGSTSYDATFLPVIFTTAQLWVTEADLTATDLASGEIDLRQFAFRQVPWVCFQYHLSHGIKHSVHRHRTPGSLADELEDGFIRTVPIVSTSEGMVRFVQWASNL
jgi:hypothetical protein